MFEPSAGIGEGIRGNSYGFNGKRYDEDGALRGVLLRDGVYFFSAAFYTLALGVTAFVLTPKQTFMALLVYVLLGCIGLPVFVGGTAGFGKLFGPTGGYIIAWLAVYPIISALKGATPNFKRYALVDIVVGIPLTYVGGLISMMLVMDVSLGAALVMAVLPYIPGDIIKCLMAAFLGVKVNEALERGR